MTNKRAIIASMFAGLTLTGVATAAPYVDRLGGNVLAAHIRSGHPMYSQARIDTAVTTYLVYLSVVGALGVVCWIAAIWSVRAGTRWTPVLATTLFVVGASVALFDPLVTDTSGDTGLPWQLGWAGLLPSIAGLVAVALLWIPRKEESR